MDLGGSIRTLTIVLGAFAFAGCAALRSEWSEKNGGPDVDAEVQTAVEDALASADDVTVSSHKNGFEQEMDVSVTWPDQSFDADDLGAAAAAICAEVMNTDRVFIEVFTDATGPAISLEGLVAEHFPALDTPYDPTQVQLEPDADCGSLE